ncbi:hypothetical protein CONLIGDRAFT_185237 [Coniochaeta ligniaria NRRL 30616]|uniref:Uncharacterized protein n=1 Tax=Coniochaeta ligniaria NRRL 30616 TaxID=1408157 RepID=A0A1J7J2B4_9PEZI|nr:hypothetical protein CONLIGDRAFT_185237 [Coniochaeta ligniaria NRRL 30616]
MFVPWRLNLLSSLPCRTGGLALEVTFDLGVADLVPSHLCSSQATFAAWDGTLQLQCRNRQAGGIAGNPIWAKWHPGNAKGHEAELLDRLLVFWEHVSAREAMCRRVFLMQLAHGFFCRVTDILSAISTPEEVVHTTSSHSDPRLPGLGHVWCRAANPHAPAAGEAAERWEWLTNGSKSNCLRLGVATCCHHIPAIYTDVRCDIQWPGREEVSSLRLKRQGNRPTMSGMDQNGWNEHPNCRGCVLPRKEGHGVLNRPQ